jgi:hypothetical protein
MVTDCAGEDQKAIYPNQLTQHLGLMSITRASALQQGARTYLPDYTESQFY